MNDFNSRHEFAKTLSMDNATENLKLCVHSAGEFLGYHRLITVELKLLDKIISYRKEAFEMMNR